MHVYIYNIIYIYIERERGDAYVCKHIKEYVASIKCVLYTRIYIYIYICICIYIYIYMYIVDGHPKTGDRDGHGQA